MKSESTDSMINGKVGLMSYKSAWGALTRRLILAEVEVEGEFVHQLEFCNNSSGRELSYRLLDTRGLKVDEWKFDSKWVSKKLIIRGDKENRDERLEYKIGAFGGAHFIDKDGKRPIHMELTNHSRAFEINGMMFKHVDFQSQIHFRCDKKKLNQAILIASVIFNPPSTVEVSGAPPS